MYVPAAALRYPLVYAYTHWLATTHSLTRWWLRRVFLVVIGLLDSYNTYIPAYNITTICDVYISKAVASAGGGG